MLSLEAWVATNQALVILEIINWIFLQWIKGLIPTKDYKPCT